MGRGGAGPSEASCKYTGGMRTVAVCAPEAVASIGTTGLRDVLVKADRSWAVHSPEAYEPLFDVALVGLGDGPVSCEGGVSIAATRVGDIPRPAIAVVPGLDDDLVPSFERNRGWAPWLRTWHEAGTIVAASCTGAFLVAEAGILEGRPATTHWYAAAEFERRYPAVDLQPARMLIDAGDVITSGGATTFLNLALHLTERFGGRERAAFAAKVLLIDGEREMQLPYMAAVGRRAHEDALVHKIQDDIHYGATGDLSVTTLAAPRRQRANAQPALPSRHRPATTGLSARSATREGARAAGVRRHADRAGLRPGRLRRSRGLPACLRRGYRPPSRPLSRQVPPPDRRGRLEARSLAGVELLAGKTEEALVEVAVLGIRGLADVAFVLTTDALGVADDRGVRFEAARVVLLEARLVEGVAQDDAPRFEGVTASAEVAEEACARLEGAAAAIHLWMLMLPTYSPTRVSMEKKMRSSALVESAQVVAHSSAIARDFGRVTS